MSDIIKRSTPNTLACSNLISGCIATYSVLTGDAKMALIWIFVGTTFDFFDDMSARSLKVSSPIGKELDSLADCVTFGVAPSTTVFHELMVIDYPSFLTTPEAFSFDLYRMFIPFLAFLMAVFLALRLAKFNIDTRRTDSFIGLPTLANVLFWGSLIVTSSTWLGNNAGALIYILVLPLLSCYLLVGEIPMFALKFKNFRWQGNTIRRSFIIFTVVVLITFGVLKGWWAVTACYFLMSLGSLVVGRSETTKMNHDKGQKLWYSK